MYGIGALDILLHGSQPLTWPVSLKPLPRDGGLPREGGNNRVDFFVSRIHVRGPQAIFSVQTISPLPTSWITCTYATVYMDIQWISITILVSMNNNFMFPCLTQYKEFIYQN